MRRHRATSPTRLFLTALLLAADAGPAAAFEVFRNPDYTLRNISPAITANPVDTVTWVRDTVTAEDEAWLIGEIDAGLAMWEDVPTAHIRFARRTIRSATRPPLGPESLVIVVANLADLLYGGASSPTNGYPGEWDGAPADVRTICPQCETTYRIVAAHEVGHAIGLFHSTVTSVRFASNIPVMQWATAGQTGLSDDDEAAISVMYPDTVTPLSSVTGTIRGTTAPGINGVNVVAVETGTGIPRVGMLSGTAAVDGDFEIVGLPAGTYDVHFLDAHSHTRAASIKVDAPDLQTDNFATFSLGPYAVSAGGVIDLGDVAIPIAPVTVDRFAIGSDRFLDSGIDPSEGVLPAATINAAYQVWMHLHGGVRALALTSATGLPPGISATMFVAPGYDPYIGTYGEHQIVLTGTPSALGVYTVELVVTDKKGTPATLTSDLEVGAMPATPTPTTTPKPTLSVTPTETVTPPPTLTATPTVTPSPIAISGAKLLVKDKATKPSARKIVFLSKDPVLDTSATGVDPTIDGASVLLYNAVPTGESVCIPLPAAQWTRSGSGPTFKYTYKDKTAANGPCKVAQVQHGKVLKIACSAKVQPIAYSLDEPTQTTMAVRFTSGATTYCAAFGGIVKKDSGTDPPNFGGKGIFQAKLADPPVECPFAFAICP